MLRSPAIFDSDSTIQSYVESGKAHLLKGDALVEDDVKRAWDKALTHGPVDFLLSSVGMYSLLAYRVVNILLIDLFSLSLRRHIRLTKSSQRFCHHSQKPRHSSSIEYIEHNAQTYTYAQDNHHLLQWAYT